MAKKGTLSRVVKRPRDLDVKLKKITKMTKGPKRVFVGLPKDAADYPDGTSVVMVGATHEFGSGHIPERSFLRTTVHEKREEIIAFWKAQGRAMLTGKVSTDKVLRLLGQLIEKAVKVKIREIDTPPNAPATVRRKGTNNPLIATGHMRQSVRYVVGQEED